MRRHIPLALAGLILAAGSALAEPTSPWAREGATALRLVDAGAAPGAASGARLAAIEIALDPGWKTYWRQPGASGVPPRFDFSSSVNVADARVVYPAPERADGEDGVTNVYHGAVMLPVTVTPRDPAAPVELKLVADYGVCEQVCVPVRAEAALELAAGGGGVGPAGDDARRAVEAAPKPLALGGVGPLAVSSVTRAPDGKAVEIAVRAPAGAEPRLFAETGGGDFAPSPERVGQAADGRATFRMTFDDGGAPASGLRFTLSAGGRAVETSVALDAVSAKP